tara:strand:- start:165 stop:680 length:516 start_codon:yes stop_codon:yes gene_type:complete
VPHLLRKHKDWKDTKIEFYGLSKGDGNAGATVKMTAAQAKLSHVLNKIRIQGNVTVLDASLKQIPSLASCNQYKLTAEQCGFDPMLPDGWEGGSGFDKEVMPNRVSRMLRLSELVAEFSTDASMVFIMLPIPREGTPPKQYCSLLSSLSGNVKCPTIFIRGNHEDVLTLYS